MRWGEGPQTWPRLLGASGGPGWALMVASDQIRPRIMHGGTGSRGRDHTADGVPHAVGFYVLVWPRTAPFDRSTRSPATALLAVARARLGASAVGRARLTAPDPERR